MPSIKLEKIIQFLLSSFYQQKKIVFKPSPKMQTKLNKKSFKNITLN